MSATGYTPISLYYSTTASTAPTNTNLVNGELAINITDGKLYYKDNAGVVQAVAILSHTNGNFSDLTGSITVAKGTTAQQPGTPITGMLRYNTTTNQFEGYSGSSPSWLPVGGSTLSNDTTTSTFEYPLFASATSGTATTIYTSNAKYLYKPSTGDLQASQLIAGNGFVVNPNTLVSSYTVAANYNASTVGPFTIPSGMSVTVSGSARWVIL
jgi:hypothetical protein